MDPAEQGRRADELAHSVIGPVVLGGPIHPCRPFGGPESLALGVERRIDDTELRNRLDVARVRQARLLAPVDALPDLDQWDWALFATLNDLLQVTNHELAGPFTRGRYARLLSNVTWAVERIPAPADLERALERHATFARVFELCRTDSKVSWWTGSMSFRGEPPSKRLMLWPELRRVNVDARRVPLSEMPAGVAGLSIDQFLDVLGLWLTRSPLTDLATLTRRAPSFAWSASTLSLIATPVGRALAFRAVSRVPGRPAIDALNGAAARIPEGYEEAKRLAVGFASTVEKGLRERGELPAEKGPESLRRPKSLEQQAPARALPSTVLPPAEEVEVEAEG